MPLSWQNFSDKEDIWWHWLKNSSGAFETICSAFDEKTYRDGYYTLNGIDYYTDANDEKSRWYRNILIT